MLNITESAEEEKNSKVLFSFATKNFIKMKNIRAITCSARAVREERAKIIVDLSRCCCCRKHRLKSFLMKLALTAKLFLINIRSYSS